MLLPQLLDEEPDKTAGRAAARGRMRVVALSAQTRDELELDAAAV